MTNEERADRFIEARECLEAIHALPIEHDERGHAFKRIECRSLNDMGAWVALVTQRLANEYAPWRNERVTEMEYRKRKYIEARQETKKLADALEFIRDCEDDEELGMSITVSFLKEQARAILQEVQP